MTNTKLYISLILIILISACQNDVSNTLDNSTANYSQESTQVEATTRLDTDTEDDQSDGDATLSFGSYDLSNEFTELIRSNPIDREYTKDINVFANSSEYSTTGLFQLESEYADIWDAELNWIYNRLLTKLNNEQKQIMIESQKGWIQNHLKETDFVMSTFQNDSEYNIGSQGLVNIEVAIKHRLRDRTIQLYEYDYLLGGEEKFLYKGK